LSKYGKKENPMKRILFSIVCISLLLSAYARAAEPDKNAQLIDAAKAGDLGAVQKLLAEGADINAKQTTTGVTALWIAAWQGHTEVVKFLLGKNVDVNTKATDGTTALWMASEHGHVEVVKLLLEKGADVNAKAITDGGTAIV
jgi:ankyrin repeat protein